MNRRDLLLSSSALLGAPMFSARSRLSAAAGPGVGPGRDPSSPNPQKGMLLIRDVFRCKPGQARRVAEMFKQTIPSMEREDGFRNCRVMVDYAATYWTVVLQAEVEDVAGFDHHMETFSSRPEVQAALAGYLDLVESGHREIYRVL